MNNTRRFQRKKTPGEKPPTMCSKKGCPNAVTIQRGDGLCANCGFFLDQAAKKAAAR